MTDTLTPLEATIMAILEGHKGRENLISRKDLVDRVNQHYPFCPVDERLVRKTRKHLVEMHGYWIASCSRGYFMIQTDEEFFKFRKYYRGYALSMLYTLAKVEKRSLPALLGQLSMEFGEE